MKPRPTYKRAARNFLFWSLGIFPILNHVNSCLTVTKSITVCWRSWYDIFKYVLLGFVDFDNSSICVLSLNVPWHTEETFHFRPFRCWFRDFLLLRLEICHLWDCMGLFLHPLTQTLKGKGFPFKGYFSQPWPMLGGGHWWVSDNPYK